jgi:D-alanine-D-alanine ligase
MTFPGAKVADAADFGRVAVLLGGTSSEREVSLDSGRNVLEALLRLGVDAAPVDGIAGLVTALTRPCGAPFDRVFNILHGNHGGGEDGVVQGLLEAFGVPYTGSGVLGSALSMDKARTKQVWLAGGLPTPRYVSLERGQDVVAAVRELGFPLIVKPACEGSSVGITRCFSDADLPAAVELASRYPGRLLVEQLVQGDEFTVAVLGSETLPSIRIEPSGEYYDYHAKYLAEDTRYVCPGASDAREHQLAGLALEAFAAAGCAGWGRVDFMCDAAGDPWLLEVNTAPGMTSHSLVPKAAAKRGIGFDELVWRVLETSFAARDG